MYPSSAPSDVCSWQRPNEIHAEAKLFIGGADDSDVMQGALGDCWFLAALCGTYPTFSGSQFGLVRDWLVLIRPHHHHHCSGGQAYRPAAAALRIVPPRTRLVRRSIHTFFARHTTHSRFISPVIKYASGRRVSGWCVRRGVCRVVSCRVVSCACVRACVRVCCLVMLSDVWAGGDH
jgi:hypothetical protein